MKTDVRLTPRETEILRLFAAGLTYVQIARKLSISRHTVDSHLRQVRSKTGLRSLPHLIDFARRMT